MLNWSAEELEINRDSTNKFAWIALDNPYHEPAGSSVGGQFAHAPAGAGQKTAGRWTDSGGSDSDNLIKNSSPANAEILRKAKAAGLRIGRDVDVTLDTPMWMTDEGVVISGAAHEIMAERMGYESRFGAIQAGLLRVQGEQRIGRAISVEGKMNSKQCALIDDLWKKENFRVVYVDTWAHPDNPKAFTEGSDFGMQIYRKAFNEAGGHIEDIIEKKRADFGKKFPTDIRQFLAERYRLHAEHDQSSHGNWATGRSNNAADWDNIDVSPEKLHDTMIARAKEKNLTVTDIEDDKKIYESAFVLPDGIVISGEQNFESTHGDLLTELNMTYREAFRGGAMRVGSGRGGYVEGAIRSDAQIRAIETMFERRQWKGLTIESISDESLNTEGDLSYPEYEYSVQISWEDFRDNDFNLRKSIAMARRNQRMVAAAEFELAGFQQDQLRDEAGRWSEMGAAGAVVEAARKNPNLKVQSVYKPMQDNTSYWVSPSGQMIHAASDTGWVMNEHQALANEMLGTKSDGIAAHIYRKAFEKGFMRVGAYMGMAYFEIKDFTPEHMDNIQRMFNTNRFRSIGIDTPDLNVQINYEEFAEAGFSLKKIIANRRAQYNKQVHGVIAASDFDADKIFILYDESKHPRIPAGSSEGGQWTSAGGGLVSLAKEKGYTIGKMESAKKGVPYWLMPDGTTISGLSGKAGAREVTMDGEKITVYIPEGTNEIHTAIAAVLGKHWSQMMDEGALRYRNDGTEATFEGYEISDKQWDLINRDFLHKNYTAVGIDFKGFHGYINRDEFVRAGFDMKKAVEERKIERENANQSLEWWQKQGVAASEWSANDVILLEYIEALHPRDEAGRWTAKGGDTQKLYDYMKKSGAYKIGKFDGKENAGFLFPDGQAASLPIEGHSGADIHGLVLIDAGFDPAHYPNGPAGVIKWRRYYDETSFTGDKISREQIERIGNAWQENWGAVTIASGDDFAVRIDPKDFELANFDMNKAVNIAKRKPDKGFALGDYDESKHPRDEKGRWTYKGGAYGIVPAPIGFEIFKTHDVYDDSDLSQDVKNMLVNWTTTRVPWQDMQTMARGIVRGEKESDITGDWIYKNMGGADAVEGGSDEAAIRADAKGLVPTMRTNFTYTQKLLDAINTHTVGKPLYRGLSAVDAQKAFKVGDTFSESLTSWTGKEELAANFAAGAYGLRPPIPTVAKGEDKVVMMLEGADMHGLNVSKYVPEGVGNADLKTADEWLTSGQYEVVSVTKKVIPHVMQPLPKEYYRDPLYAVIHGMPPDVFKDEEITVVKVRRIGNAKAPDLRLKDLFLANFDPNQPRDEKGQWSQGGGTGAVIMYGRHNPHTIQSMTKEGRVYRAMSEEEYTATVAHGTGVHSAAPEVGRHQTSFSDTAPEAMSWADDPRRTGKPAYIVEVEGHKGMRQHPDGTWTTKPLHRIGEDRITRVFRVENVNGELIGHEVDPALYHHPSRIKQIEQKVETAVITKIPKVVHALEKYEIPVEMTVEKSVPFVESAMHLLFGEYDESKHPRDERGRWTEAGDVSTAGDAESFINDAKDNGEIVLFHSGDASIDSKLKEGIEPQTGAWVEEVMSGATDDPDTIEEIENQGGASFYSREPSWVSMKVARVLNKSVNEVTVDDILKHGQLSILSTDPSSSDFYAPTGNGMAKTLDGRFIYERDTGMGYSDPNIPFGVEPNDVFSTETQVPSVTLTGKELVKFLAKNYPNANILKEGESLVERAKNLSDGFALGGEGSGNFGHSGRPGLVGGSGKGNGAGDPSVKSFIEESTAAYSSVKDFENTHVDKEVEYACAFDENGNVIVPPDRTSNSTDSIQFTKEEMEKMMSAKNVVFSHNHPRDQSFSEQDIDTASQLNLREIRAVGKDNEYRMIRLGDKWPKPSMQGYDTLFEEIQFIHYQVSVQYPTWERWKAKGATNAREASLMFSDEVMKRFAAKHPNELKYVKTKRQS